MMCIANWVKGSLLEDEVKILWVYIDLENLLIVDNCVWVR